MTLYFKWLFIRLIMVAVFCCLAIFSVRVFGKTGGAIFVFAVIFIMVILNKGRRL